MEREIIWKSSLMQSLKSPTYICAEFLANINDVSMFRKTPRFLFWGSFWVYSSISGTETYSHFHKHILIFHKAFETYVYVVSVNRYLGRYFSCILLLCGGRYRLLEAILGFEHTSDLVFYSSKGKSKLSKTLFFLNRILYFSMESRAE